MAAHAIKPYVYTKEHYIHSKEPYTHSKEPYIHSKEPHSHCQSCCRYKHTFTHTNTARWNEGVNLRKYTDSTNLIMVVQSGSIEICQGNSTPFPSS